MNLVNVKTCRQRKGLGDAAAFIARPARPILHAIKVQSIYLHTPRLRSRVAQLLPGHVLKPKTQVPSAPGIAKPHVVRSFLSHNVSPSFCYCHYIFLYL